MPLFDDRRGSAGEAVEGLAHVALVHNVFDQVAATGGHNVDTKVGAVLEREGLDGVGFGQDPVPCLLFNSRRGRTLPEG